MLPTLQCFQHWYVPFSRGFQPVTFLWNAASTCMYHSAVASHFSVERCMNMYVPFSGGWQPVTFLRNAAWTCMYHSAVADSQSLFCGTLHEHVCTIQRWLTASHFSAERCMNMYVPFSGGQSLFCGTLHEHVCTIQWWLTASHFPVERCMNMRCCRLSETSSWPSTSCICILYAIGQKWIRAFMQLMHENVMSNHSMWELYRRVTSIEMDVHVQRLHLPNTHSQPTLLPVLAVVAYA